MRGVLIFNILPDCESIICCPADNALTTVLTRPGFLSSFETGALCLSLSAPFHQDLAKALAAGYQMHVAKPVEPGGLCSLALHKKSINELAKLKLQNREL